MKRVRNVRVRNAVLRSATMLALAGVSVSACSTAKNSTATTKPSSNASSKDVLLVGTFDGKRGGYSTIQAAVNAARPGDWYLCRAGDYHEIADQQATPHRSTRARAL